MAAGLAVRLAALEFSTPAEVEGALSVEDARSAHQAAQADAARLQASYMARSAMEARQGRLRQSHGVCPDVGGARAAEEHAHVVGQAAGDRRRECEAALASALAAEGAAIARLEAARTESHNRADAARRWEEAASVLAEPVDGATAEEAEAALVVVGVTREAALDAHAQRARVQSLREAQDIRSELDAATAEAARWREVATTGIPARVTQILEGLNVPGWGLDEQLMAADPDRDGEMIPYSALSDGRRLDAAVHLALRGSAGSAILILPQKLGEQMDPSAWARIGRMAEEKKIYVLSAKIGEGPLTLARV